MTALKPIENRRVRAVASERYPLNETCAHPECAEPAVDPHHAFPRSAIGGDSWFVAIFETVTMQERIPALTGKPYPVDGEHTIIPHVTGLCRAHHDDVEEHRAWIRLEDGVWLWFDREPAPDHLGGSESNDGWRELGPLNPQPGSKTGKPKRRKFKGEARRKRATISIKVPKDDQEDGAGIWDERLEQVRERMAADGVLDPDRPPYNIIVDVLYDWSTRPREEELDG